jgi:hypothetical protein
MKRIILLSSLILAVTVSSVFQGCGTGGSRKMDNNSDNREIRIAGMVFSEYEYDFGRVHEGKTVKHNFSFYNNGTGDLTIISAAASCGCTVSKYDKKPIPPGEKGKIEVSFDTKGRSGRQTKTISVTSNAFKPVIFLRISAEVVSSNNN